MTFTTPLALLLLLAVPYTIWLGRAPASAPRPRREWISVGLRTVILLLLVFSLAGAQSVRTADELSVVFLVDASDSISAEQAEAAEQYVRDTIAEMGPNDASAVVMFGANALVERPISRIDEIGNFTSVPQTLQTDLAEAIRLGIAIFPAGTARRIVVLSDGAATIGDTTGAARLAAAGQVEISYVPLLRQETRNEVWIAAVSAPTRVSADDRFTVRATVRSTSRTTAVARLIGNGRILREETVELSAGENNLIFGDEQPIPAGEQGFSRFVVQIEPLTDTYFQNNQLAAYTEVAGPPRVLLVAPDGTLNDEGQPVRDEAPLLRSALEAANFVVEQITPGQLPISYAELSNYATIVLANVNAKQLSPRQMEFVRNYVSELGGGLVVVGGPESYGMGGYFETPLEEVLPVEMRINDEERFPDVAIAIVIDRSGSMGAQEGSLTKIELAAEAAVRVVELLNDFDEIAVIPVDTSPSGVVGPISAGEREEAIRRIREIGAGGGGIYVRTGLEEAQRILQASDKEVKHIILLADGSDSEEKNGVPELIDELTAENITLTAVSIGNGSDLAWLQQMAERGNGRFHFTDRAANLPQIFTQETVQIQRSYLIEEAFFPTLNTSSPILRGIEAVPALEGYVGTSPKSTAVVPLVTHQNDPLLATWQYGLGRSVAWTSDATGRWAINWLGWEQFPQFWAQTVRWTVSRGRNTAVETVVSLEGETARLQVDARQPQNNDNYLNGLEMDASVVSPSGESINLTLQQTAPGRYEAEFAPTEQGAYFLRVAGTDPVDEGISVAQTTGWVLGYSPEYLSFDEDPQLLANLAAQTGGQDLSGNPAGVFAHNLPVSSTTRPLWPYLLLIAVLLLPVDVGLRRVVVTRRDWQRLRDAIFGRRAVETVSAERESQMSSLFDAKKRAGRAERESAQPMIRTLPPEPTATSAASYQKETPPEENEGDEDAPAPGSNTLASRLLQRKRGLNNRGDDEEK